jgi:hypothetical protein
MVGVISLAGVKGARHGVKENATSMRNPKITGEIQLLCAITLRQTTQSKSRDCSLLRSPILL